jgi:hypothetical protein
MTIVLWLGLLVVVFIACRWSGSMLDRHYNDRHEVAAVLVVALCVLGSLVFGSSRSELGDVPLQVSLALAVGVGLFTGGHRHPS